MSALMSEREFTLSLFVFRVPGDPGYPVHVCMQYENWWWWMGSWLPGNFLQQGYPDIG